MSTKVGPATIEDLRALPDEAKGYELIDGVIVAKEASARHAGAQGRIIQLLSPYDRNVGGRHPGGWWILPEVHVKFAERRVYCPDISGWRRERLPVLPKSWPTEVRPDWVCEVLSTNKRNDLIRKKRGYHDGEVSHYWIVDPFEETLTIYRWHQDGYLELGTVGRDERVRAEPFEAIEIPIGVLFGDDLED